MNEEQVNVKFRRENGELYISCDSLEEVMEYAVRNADVTELEGMQEMQEIILQALDTGKTRSLITP